MNYLGFAIYYLYFENILQETKTKHDIDLVTYEWYISFLNYYYFHFLIR